MLLPIWIVNGLLALAFLGAGGFKLVGTKKGLISAGMGWVTEFPFAVVKLIGVAEVVGAVGVIVPLATLIVPILSPIAATCLLILMIGAIVVHLRRKESAAPAIGLACLSAASAIIGFLVITTF